MVARDHLDEAVINWLHSALDPIVGFRCLQHLIGNRGLQVCWDHLAGVDVLVYLHLDSVGLYLLG